jgi:hypothetical protein
VPKNRSDPQKAVGETAKINHKYISSLGAPRLSHFNNEVRITERADWEQHALVLILILFLAFYTLWLRAIVPMFQKHILSTYTNSTINATIVY